eukprot:6587906-Pyramimonas_sp.AAC.1
MSRSLPHVASVHRLGPLACNASLALRSAARGKEWDVAGNRGSDLGVGRKTRIASPSRIWLREARGKENWG